MNDNMQAAEKIVAATLGGQVMPGHSETVRLIGWIDNHDEAMPQVKARLFGEIVRRAALVVEEYHSDLFSDALRLDKMLTGPCEFDLLLRKHGTHLSFDGDLFNAARGMAVVEHDVVTTTLYRVAVRVGVDRGDWWATFTVQAKDRTAQS